MKRILFVVLSVAAWTLAIAQQLTHVVQRGETFEIIARRYNISVAQLKESNPNIDQCFVGIKLNIPQGAKMSSRLTIVTPQDMVKIDEAASYFKNGRYSKAVSTYTKVLKSCPSSSSYFGRGISYYNLEKYKSAINDLEMAMSSPDCTPEMEERCEEIIETAKKLRQEQRERRNAKLGEVAAVVVGAAAVAVSASMASNSSANSAYMPPSQMNGFQRDTRYDYLLDPRLAVVQVQQQEYQEYTTFKQLSGANISLEEYRNLKMKANYYDPHANDYLLDPKFAAAQVQQQELEEYEHFKKLSGTDITLDQYRILKYSSGNQEAGVENNYNSYHDDSSSKTKISSDRSYSQKSRHECSACKGKGTIERNDGTIATFGNSYKKKCPICGWEYWNSTFHRHETCRWCGGKGYQEY